MARYTNQIIALLFLIARCSNTFGQLYNFTNYSIDQGLPQSTVFCVHEDALGYLWLGTESGVAHFDGKQFKVYDQSSGLPGNSVRSIISGPSNNIWVGTDKGIGIYNGSSWKTITAADGLHGSAILKLTMDGQNRVWATTNDAGINIITLGDSLSIEIIDETKGLSSNFVFDVLHDTLSKRSWIAMIGGLNIITETADGFSVFNLEDSVTLPSSFISSIDKDNEGNLWFGTLDVGAFKFIIKNGTYHIKEFGVLEGIGDPKIWDVTCVDGKQVWFASNDNGRYCLENGKIQNISMENGLPGNLILNVYRDSKRNLWLGSMGNGLTLWRGKSLVHYTREQGLPGQKVLAVKNTPDGKLWVGTDEKGLALLQFSNDKMKAQYFDEKQGFKSQQVISVDLDNNQNLILATRGDGMARFINGGFHYLSTLDGLADNTINRVFWSPNNTVYVATNLGFNEVSQNKIYTISEDDGLINSEVQSIISDHQGNIWMGTMGGLAFFQAKTNTYRDFNEEEGLFDLKIYCLADDKFANIWMGTANGIYKYILNRDTIIRMSELELNSKIINSLLFLNDSTLIVGSNLGFNKVIFDTNIEKLIRKESYDKQNGLKFI
jgi:ligand-binding sensor domain-containing protein